MHVVTGKYLKEAVDRFPAAAKQTAAWRSVARDARWCSPADVKNIFADADFNGEYATFRIHQGQYRLVTTIHYSRQQNGRIAEGHIWIRSFLTEKQYENTANWDKGVVR
ncbi:MAG: type II toxin-antitoxin system HigB family toxin [Acidobacteriaceae bacterium]